MTTSDVSQTDWPGHKPAAPARLAVPTDLETTVDVVCALNVLLADVYALYIKTKNFHWHVSGPYFRDYHGLLEEHADELLGITDAIAERVRKLGATTLRSVGHIARLQTVVDNDTSYVQPHSMFLELHDDHNALVRRLRSLHSVCSGCGDVATAGLLEVWIDEAERRKWILFEVTR
jgi:starvation-inducible DNA-binding protein